MREPAPSPCRDAAPGAAPRGRHVAGLVVALLLALAPFGRAVAQTADGFVAEVAGFRCYAHLVRPQAWQPLCASIRGSVARIRRDLGPDVLSGGEVHVVVNIDEFLAQRGESAQAPGWAQAIALPAQRLIVLRVPDPNPVRTLTHELSHLAVHDAAGGHHVPRWFDEGYAMLQAEEWGIQRTITISQAALFGNTIDFDDLDTSFPPHWLTAGLAYAQSFHLVRQLLSQHDPSAVRQWLAGIAAGQPWRDAFRQAFGMPVAQVFRRWRDSVRVWYGWIPAIISVSSLWAALSVLVVWAYRRSRRRVRQRLAAMEQAERELYPPDPDDDLF